LTRRRWFLAAALALCACLATATARTAAPVLSFGVIADVQYRDADPQGTRFYRDSRAKLEQAIERLNAARNGIHYVNLKGMVEGRETAYAVVELYADSMKINGYGREESRTLAVRQREGGASSAPTLRTARRTTSGT
jgi:hypothetical protein